MRINKNHLKEFGVKKTIWRDAGDAVVFDDERMIST